MKTRTIDDAALRRLIDGYLHKPMTDREWVKVEKRYGAEIQGSTGALKSRAAKDAAAFVLDAREMESDTQPRGPRLLLPGGRDVPLDEWTRELFVSMAVAGYAHQDADVRAFREEVLGCPFASLSDRDQGTDRGTGDPAEWIEREWAREQVESTTANEVWPLLRYAPLPYQGDTDDTGRPPTPPVRTLRVAPGGILNRLRLLGERLAREYRWDPSAAITFILTGAIPIIPTLTTRVDWPRDHHDLSVLTRIVLTVDPTLTADDVAHAYGKVRSQVVTRIPRQKDEKRHEKAWWLAALTAGSPPAPTLAGMMEWWNRSGPGWKYSDHKKFGRERNNAEQWLLRPVYRRPADDQADDREED